MENKRCLLLYVLLALNLLFFFWGAGYNLGYFVDGDNISYIGILFMLSGGLGAGLNIKSLKDRGHLKWLNVW